MPRHMPQGHHSAGILHLHPFRPLPGRVKPLTDTLNTGVEGRAEHKHGGDALEAVGEGPGVAPVPETDRLRALDAARDIAALSAAATKRAPGWPPDSHNGEEEIRHQADELDERKPELSLAKRLDTKQLEAEEGELSVSFWRPQWGGPGHKTAQSCGWGGTERSCGEIIQTWTKQSE